MAKLKTREIQLGALLVVVGGLWFATRAQANSAEGQAAAAARDAELKARRRAM